MATNMFFSMSVAGSKVTLTPYEGPYVSGSWVAYTGPVGQYTDAYGNIQFNNVIAGIYKVVVSNKNANTTNFVNNTPDTFYVNLPDSSGSLVSGVDYIITSSTI